MATLTGTFATPNAQKYLQQLCKHFGHKIPVDYTAEKGTCDFDMGQATLNADDAALTVTFQLDDSDSVPAAKGVIDKHLEKFAFRENFQNMTWTS